jgi:hypothetical protein
MRSGSVSVLGINLTTCMDRAIGMAGLITFGFPDIGADGAMAITFGVMVITRCANKIAAFYIRPD